MKANAIGQCIERAGDTTAGMLLLYLLLQYADGSHVAEGHLEMRASEIAEDMRFSAKQYSRALRILSKAKIIFVGRSALGSRTRSRPGTRITVPKPARDWARSIGILPGWSASRMTLTTKGAPAHPAGAAEPGAEE